MRVPCEKFVRAKLLMMDSMMDSQPMHIEVTDEAQTLVDQGLVEVVPEGEASQATTGAEAEAPAPEAPALPADTAMADGEGHGTAEAAWLEQISKQKPVLDFPSSIPKKSVKKSAAWKVMGSGCLYLLCARWARRCKWASSSVQ